MVDPLAKIKQKLLEEIDHLSHELNVDLPKEIAVARAHGDLSENAEYKYAKERQGFVNARIGQLKKTKNYSYIKILSRGGGRGTGIQHSPRSPA